MPTARVGRGTPLTCQHGVQLQLRQRQCESDEEPRGARLKRGHQVARDRAVHDRKALLSQRIDRVARREREKPAPEQGAKDADGAAHKRAQEERSLVDPGAPAHERRHPEGAQKQAGVGLDRGEEARADDVDERERSDLEPRHERGVVVVVVVVVVVRLDVGDVIFAVLEAHGAEHSVIDALPPLASRFGTFRGIGILKTRGNRGCEHRYSSAYGRPRLARNAAGLADEARELVGAKRPAKKQGGRWGGRGVGRVVGRGVGHV
eukprot:5551951-Prymnesium_polylepis.1